MKSGTTFLLAARQCEIAELEELARTGALVGAIARLVHALQRERGLSNMFLASQGCRFGEQRLQQVADCQGAEQQVRLHFDALDTGTAHPRNGARLFNRVAIVLHALDGLPALRARVAVRALPARDATASYSKLVAGLLAVVFEAADTATDPEVSRALVAMFNYMQGKEFAGQERAHGGSVFATGQVDPAGQQQWRHLVDAQQSCLRLFADFADAEVLRADHRSQDPEVAAQVERLRHIGCTMLPGALDTDFSQDWYEWTTRRIDAMRRVEDVLATHLRQLCQARIARARADLHDERAMLEALARDAAQPGAEGAAPMGPHLERSVLALVQEQSRRLQAMGDELAAVRASLHQRKVIERAKGLLMAHRHLSEEDAYKALRQMAMNQNRRLVDVAEAVLALAEVLPGR